MSGRVLVLGLGEVGQWVLEFLGRRPEVSRVIAADVRPDVGRYRVDTAALSCALGGYDTPFEFHQLDVNDIDGTARLIEAAHPDVIFTSMAVSSWYVLNPPSEVPKRALEKLLPAGFGFLVPWHVLLTSKVVRAMMKCGTEAILVNASYPDVVNHLLKCYHGFDRCIGAGKIDQVVGELQVRVARLENVPYSDVVVYLLGSSSIADQSEGAVPFRTRVLLGDVDLAQKYDVDDWIKNRLTGFMSETGRALHLFSATGASAVKNIVAILNDSHILTHVPGPNGVLGTYPARVGANGAEIALPEGVDLEAALALNRKALTRDGIKDIREDGTVEFTEASREVLREVGYDCPTLSYDDLEARAKELVALVPSWKAM